ncbi:helix-turn-helix domain-containing protein [Novosphingobium sp.]|uniref:helix-turn-helix domain-containing protein n=1 Tax=Novosphingobium sp. TaxID=1874826 RepID=UPI003B5243B4
MRHESTSTAMLAALRRHLRQEGWTVLRIAQALSIGEATAKRWLAGKGVTLDRLDTLARLARLTLGELAREAEDAPSDLAHELTLAQEKALSTNIFLSFLFMALLNGVPPDEIAGDFAVPQRAMDAALARLERLALIDRLRGGRIRVRVDRALVFRKLPLRSLFDTHMKSAFFELDYGDPETCFGSEVLKLSRAGAAQLAELMERYRIDVQALADHDRQTATIGREWYGTLMVMRMLDMSQLRRAGLGDLSVRDSL